MASARYAYATAVRDATQLNSFFRTHMGDPFLFSETDGGTTYINTSETSTTEVTRARAESILGKYPNPAPQSRGPKASIVIDVKRGGTGRSAIPTGTILFGQDLNPLSSDATFKYDNATKSLTVTAISGSPTGPTSITNKAYVDSLSYLTTGAGLTLAGGILTLNSAQAFESLTIAGKDVATQAFVQGQGYITRALSETLFEPVFTVSPALVKSNGVVSLAANQPTISSVGTLTGLNISGPVTSSSTITLTGTTTSTSTANGALVTPSIGCSGNINAGNIFLSGAQVASQPWVLGLNYITQTSAAQLYEPVLTIGSNLTRLNRTLSLSPSISISELALSGAMTSSSTVTLTGTTSSTSTTTGAMVVPSLGCAGNLYAGNLFIGTAQVASQSWVTGLGYLPSTLAASIYLTQANASQLYDPLTTIGSNLTRTNGTLSLNPSISISGLTLSGPLTSNNTFSSTSTTPATSTTTGALTFPNGGGISTTGAVYAGSLFVGANAVATQAWSTAAFDPISTFSGGLTRSATNVVTVNSTLPAVTSVGTLSALALSGPLTTSSTLSSTSTTAATSTNTGALTFPNGGGISTTGAIYGAAMFVGANPVATQSFTAATYEPILSISTGLLRSGNVITVNPNQSLTSLTLTGGTASTSVSTGTLVLSGSSGLGVGGAVYASSMFVGTATVATQPWCTATFDPLTTIAQGLTRTAANVLSVNSTLGHVTAIGTLSALALSGPLTTTSTFSSTSTTAATSTTTGALTFPNGGGISTTGAIYGAAMFVGANPVATQSFTAATYEPILSISNGLLRSGNVISVNPNLSLTGLTLTGPTTSNSTFTSSSTTPATSTTTGALTFPNGGGISTTGAIYGGSMFVGANAVATQAFTMATFEPILAAGTGITKSGNVLSVNPNQSLTGLTLTGGVAATSVSTGTLVLSGASGLGVGGAIYASSMFIGTAAVATQAWATANLDPLSTFTTGVTRSAANVVTVNSSLGHVTAVGTLSSLALSGPLTSTSTFSSTSTTAATSTTTGALTFPNGGGISTTGAIYGNSMFVGANPVATQAWSNSTFEPVLAAGSGILKSGNVLSVNPNLSLTGLTLTGATDSTALGVGCLVLQGGLSNAKNITTTSLTLASGMALTAFSGGSWMNLPTSGPSGIGTGGAGANCFIGYCAGPGNWFTNAALGDVAYRNANGRIMWGNTSGDASMVLSGDNLGIGTATPTAKLDVTGNANISGTISVGTIGGTSTTMGGSIIMMSDGYDAAATSHTISFLTTAQGGAGYIFVYCRNANGSSAGSMIVGFYKPVSGAMTAASISTSKPTLLTLSAAGSGNNVVVTTSAGCSIACTINMGS
jgi:trimeric autotransporter adhesin